jgi:hypothetical protein
MLFCIAIVGGLTLMMGQHALSESLFYYFRLEDQVPENHLLRLIDKHIDFGFVRERLQESYSDTGRPSIDPELLLRILLIGYLYGIDSERKLVEELRVQATGALLSEESRAAENMIARFAQWQGRKPQSIAADASYGNGAFLQWLMDREITPYMPTRDAVGRTRSLLWSGVLCLLAG